MLEQVMVYQGTGSIAAPYLLKYQPNLAFSAQMQAYIEYLHSVNPAINKITINFRLHAGGTGNAPVMGAQIGTDHFVTWTSGGPLPAPQNFFGPSQLMQINQWYVVHTGIYLEDRQQFFDASCANKDIGVRVQVLEPIPMLRTPPPPTLQFLRKGRPMIEKPLC